MNVDLLRLQSGGACGRAERRLRVLCSYPDIEPVELQIHGRIHWLHWRVRQIRRLIDGLERLGRARHRFIEVPVVARGYHASAQRRAVFLRKLPAIDTPCGADIPFGPQTGQRSFSAPEAVGRDNGHCILKFDHADNARHARKH